MSQAPLSPYRFNPVYKHVLWGGDEIARFKGVPPQGDDVDESWEVSDIDGYLSVVDGGPDDGMTLRELIARHRHRLVGEENYRRHGNRFPLLIKIIDAHRDLSVQVHPDDTLARRRHGCNGKSEMWYVLNAHEGARIGAGLTRHVTPIELLRHLEKGTVMELVSQPTVQRGDVFYLPTGRIHAIGAGTLLVEVQQASDVTYRLYDYDRVDSNGKRRQLHTDLAMEAIDYRVSETYVTHFDEDQVGEVQLVSCPQFAVRRIVVDGRHHMVMPLPPSFVVMMCIGGECTVTDNNGTQTSLSQGQTILVPAAVTALAIKGRATLLAATC